MILVAESGLGSLKDIHGRDYFDADLLDEIGVSSEDADAVYIAIQYARKLKSGYAVEVIPRHAEALARIATYISNTEDATAEDTRQDREARTLAGRASRSLATLAHRAWQLSKGEER